MRIPHLQHLQRQHPRQLIRLHTQESAGLAVRLDLSINSRLDIHRERLAQMDRHLKAIGPMEVLARGYSITTLKKTGAIVRATTQAAPGDQLLTRLADGHIESIVNGANLAPLRRRKPDPDSPNQGKLF